MMKDKLLESLVERVSRLEEENQRLRDARRQMWCLVGAAAVVLLAVVSLGAAEAFGPGTFRPHVIVQDPKTGTRSVDMVATDAGAGGFQVWDRAGRRRILLGTNDEGQAGLTFWNEKGEITDRFWQTRAEK